jgi:putative alpha-1,2-mannosidase
LNGKDYPYSYIHHKDIMQGGVIKFKMGSHPNRNFGAKPEFRPVSSVPK